MEKKKTQKEMFNEIIKFAQEQNRTDIVEFCKQRIEVLDKKSNSRSGKETATQKENKALMEVVLEVLKASGQPMTVSEVMAEDERLSGLSNQKVSALLRKLKDEGSVMRDDTGRKTLFSAAGLNVEITLE